MIKPIPEPGTKMQRRLATAALAAVLALAATPIAAAIINLASEFLPG